ncbi:MAG: L,D-transpeptidase family protein [Bacteroidota bacterium]|nr:L,D-transpeptidase family protein [Bacteroidota bacterium]
MNNEIKALFDQRGDSALIPESDSQIVFLNSEKVLSDYYQKKNYTLIWINETGILNSESDALIQRIRNAYLDGLNPADYHLKEIESALLILKKNQTQSFLKKEVCARLDVLLTDAYITYASHQYAGRVHSENENTEWLERIAEINPVDSLKLVKEGIKIDSILEKFTCKFTQYKLLKARLEMLYKEKNNIVHSNIDTIPIENKIKIIAINMERYRWLPRKVPDVYIMANLAGFYVEIKDHNIDTLNMKIIIGKPEQPTPLFHSKMTCLILNPWWEIPSGIAKKEMLPQIKIDKNYLVKNNIKVFEYKKINSSYIRLSVEREINWDLITSNNFRYKLRQAPGPWNALGQIKFVFPNTHDIYFHDTPGCELFSKSVRTFSHGCIRIEKPLELAAYLLKQDVSWIIDKLREKKEIVLRIPASPMVYICYWTTWVDKNGKLKFASDIYGYDQKLLNSFREFNPVILNQLSIKNSGIK